MTAFVTGQQQVYVCCEHDNPHVPWHWAAHVCQQL